MSSPQPGQPPAATPPADQPPGQGEADRVESLDARFGKIEKEQADQRGLLEQIKSLVDTGKTEEGKAHAAAQQHTEDRLANPPAETVAEQVRRAVEQVGADAAARQRQAEHDQHHQQLREQAERPPAQQISGWRGRLQKAMYGGDR